MPQKQGPNKLVASASYEDNPLGRRIISHVASQSVRPYSTNQEYLYAMREDLADWLKGLYAVEITAANFFAMLETGTLLCQHANNITTCAEYIRKNDIKVDWTYVKKFPTKYLLFNQGKFVRATSFFARDNIASFIGYCRKELEISESVMFETNDLVLRYNEKNVILCLLEVARRGSKFGVPAPVLIQMEEDIDKEIEMEKVAKKRNEPPPQPVEQKVTCDFKSLDEMVQHILGMCTCPSQFPMVRVSDGKYKVGDSENLIFMRILRQHVMVRVGGGWDTLEHYLNKHDPCRCQKHKTERPFTPRHSRSQSANRTSLQQSPPQNVVTSTGSSLKTSPANKRVLGNTRLAKSTNNLTDVSRMSKFEKSPNCRSVATRSRNSSVSETSTSDTRPSKPKFSKAPEQSVSTARTPRSVTSRKNRLSSSTEDVFSRLSRPKSTPPVRDQKEVFQDDLLVVQRNKKGTHSVQRKTTSGNLTARSPQTNRANNSPDKGPARSKSVASRPYSQTERSFSVAKTPRQNTTTMVNRRSQSGRNTGAKSTPTKPTKQVPEPSAAQKLDVSEKELLEAFEKECISNQASLQSSLTSRSRISSNESSCELLPQASRSSAEDAEVAMHMQPTVDLNRPSSNYHSLPRPRKDKVDKTEHPTRIPTPISFGRPMASGKSLDLTGDGKVNGEEIKRKANKQKQLQQEKQSQKQQPQENQHHCPQNFQVTDKRIENEVKKVEKSKDNEQLKETSYPVQANPEDAKPIPHLTNGSINETPLSPLSDIRQPRYAISVDEINRILNSSRNNIEKKLRSNSKITRGILTEYPDTSLRSSEDNIIEKPNQTFSAFAPVKSRPVVNGNASARGSNFSKPPKRPPPSAYPSHRRNISQVTGSFRLDLNDNISSFRTKRPGSAGRSSAHLFESSAPKVNNFLHSKIKQNGFHKSLNSTDSEEHWV